MSLANLLFSWIDCDSSEAESVRTDRRMLKLKNCVVLTEETHTREGVVIDASYYVTSIRVQDAFPFANLREAEAFFEDEILRVTLLPQYRSLIS
jgi:hypothetical protein